jgi:hypothetical protein
MCGVLRFCWWRCGECVSDPPCKECRLVRCWKEVNEMAAIGDFIRLFRAEDLKPDKCGEITPKRQGR